ncbi:MAG: HPr family phosphocarrier protein [Litorivicinus sp.]
MNAQARLTLVNPKGLHARASHKLVQTICEFECQCQIHFGERSADGRQIMSVMLLAAPVGSELDFHCQGPQARACLDAITVLIADGLGELGERTDP